MYIFHTIIELNNFLIREKTNGNTIGFVPTMGALHEGHMSLIQEAKRNNNIVVASIFVNPTQFNNASDLTNYPKTIDQDILKLETNQCDVLFLPDVAEMYPNGMDTLPHYNLGPIEEKLEGQFRPGHFQGVAIIVHKLLNAVQPHNLYMGQKDYQQCLIVKELIDRNGIDTQLHIVPIKRAADGLALSSRNMRLTEGERQLANLLYQCLVSIQAQNGNKPFAVVQKECWDILERKGITPEYILLCNADTLDTIEEYDSHQPMIVLIAAYLGEIRLIDNLVI